MIEHQRCNELIYAAKIRSLDEEASAQWGLHPFALVEAAGRACAGVFSRMLPREQRAEFSLVALAGKGNNAADILVMLRALIMNGDITPSHCSVFAARVTAADKPLLSGAKLAVQKLGVPVRDWDTEKAADILAKADVIIDGITGTGLTGPLRGDALEMTEMTNILIRDTGRPFIVSVDIPSGSFDGWQPGMPIIKAHATLAIEPQKLCLYLPALRPHAGRILPVTGIFPSALARKYRDAERLDWAVASERIPPVPKTAHKYERGLAEIWAGSPGSAGAARLAALGAQAAGAGLVRLIVDPALYPVIAPGCSGIMAVPADTKDDRFVPSAVLMGPGWGRGEDRIRLLKAHLPLEEQGLPLILDADAIALAKDIVFHGNAIITPHPGEFAAYTGLAKAELLADPVPALRRFSAEKKVHILLKSHVLYAASPDGRLGIIDGMNPALAAGGSGDVLAGFCAAITARCKAIAQAESFDGYTCACAAASLLVQAAEADGIAKTFADPAETARAAAAIAGKAWLGGGI